MRWVAITVVLTGCHELFGIDRLPDDDGDGDGVNAPTDNCIDEPNPDQENEDGDAWGDACDPCPTTSETAPIDDDGDGVSSSCDPHPSTPGDSIVLFEGFSRALPSDWITHGTWTVANGQATVTSDSHSKEYLVTPLARSGHVTVSTSVSGMPEPYDYDWKVGATSRIAASIPPTTVACVIGRSFMAQDVLQLYHFPISTSPRTMFRLDATTTLSMEDDGASMICRGAASGDQAQVTDSNIPDTDRIGLFTDCAAPTGARFDWLLVVQTQ